ncbi:MAG: sporulation protein Cse60 [Erysipelotrichaceae bacterium]|nr:sporulation protein Cse60 [Erysipelotrichaceae bacterium]
MIQVKVLIETDEEELEEVVNSFLEDMDELEVLSIQYSMCQVLVDEEIETTYGAMIIYRLELE